MKTRLSYLAAMILYCLATNLTGQNETLVFHHLTTADDLTSQKFNYYVRKDSRGFVRISSADGLSIYDGREIQGIQTGPRRDSSRTLANPNISSSFFEDKAGDIWFSVIDGIQQYDRKHDRFLFHEMNLDGKKYEEDCYLVYLDTVDQNLWTRVDDTLMTWSLEDPGRRHIIERHEPLSIAARMFRNPEAEELILLAPQSDGIQVRRFRSLDEQQDPAEYLPGFQVSCFHFIDDRTCWVGTDKGLVLLNLTNGVFQIFDGFEGEPITRIKGIVAPKEGELIIATQYNGLFRFSTKLGGYLNSIHMYREEGTGPFRYSIDALYLDYDQTLWISTTGKGIFFTNLWKKRFKALLQTEIGNSSCDGSIRSLAEDRKGRLWSLTSDGVTVIDTSGKAMPNFDRLSGQGVPFYAQAPYFLFVDDHDRIWAAMQQGLYFLPHARANFAPVAVADDSAGSMKTFTHVTQLSDGAVIAASTKGIFEAKAEGRAPPLLHRQKGVVPREGKFSWIREIPEENQVIVRRVEHSFQVYHPSENKWTLLTATRFKPFVNYLTRDCSGNFYWIATPRGLYRMTVSADSIRIRQDTILPFRTLNALLQDEATGHLWISTNRGLVRYVVETGRWQVYGIADGIQGDDFNFWSACKTREGKMAFGGVNGFNLFHPQEINQFPIAARPVITSILINEKQPRKPLVCEITGSANVTEIRSIKRAHSDNTFHIRFAALEFSDPKANTFRYKMSGIDDQWVKTTGENLARYANLRHGRYLFELQASNSDLEWSDITKTLEIVITPPWYLLPAFQVIWALMVILVLYLLYKRHIKKLRKQQEAKLEQEAMQRKLAEFKQQEAEFKQQEAEFSQLVAETEIAVLRLQMNPHFIFNSMTAIRNYIREKDIETASHYLDRFSMLMRMILQHSQLPFITVAEEIRLLSLYLETEAMRFEDQFDFEIITAPRLIPEETLIPTMILQPFVENALLHGIRPKAHKGLIKILFRHIDDDLECIVEDNGIGRARARELKKGAASHESKAISITERRLQLLGPETDSKLGVRIEDLFDQQGNPAGTRVHIVTPGE